MSRLTRDGTAEPVSRDQIIRHARGQGNVHFPCSADHEQDWQPYYPVDPYSAICDDHTYIHYIHTFWKWCGIGSISDFEKIKWCLAEGKDGIISLGAVFGERLFAVHGPSERTTVQTSSLLLRLFFFHLLANPTQPDPYR